VIGLPEELYLQAVYFGNEEVPNKKVNLISPGLQSSRLEIRLSGDSSEIEGAVRETDNEPARGVTVTLVPRSDLRGDEQLFRSVITDQNGNFRIKGIAPGEYKLFAWEDLAPGGYLDQEFLKTYEDRVDPITLRAKERKTIELRVIAP